MGSSHKTPITSEWKTLNQINPAFLTLNQPTSFIALGWQVSHFLTNVHSNVWGKLFYGIPKHSTGRFCNFPIAFGEANLSLSIGTSLILPSKLMKNIDFLCVCTRLWRTDWQCKPKCNNAILTRKPFHLIPRERKLCPCLVSRRTPCLSEPCSAGIERGEFVKPRPAPHACGTGCLRAGGQANSRPSHSAGTSRERPKPGPERLLPLPGKVTPLVPAPVSAQLDFSGYMCAAL